MARYPLIASGVLTEEATSVVIDKDNNNAAFRLTHAILSVEVVGTATNTANNGTLRIRLNSNTAATGGSLQTGNMIRNTALKKQMQIEIAAGLFLSVIGYSDGAGVIVSGMNSNFDRVTAVYLAGTTTGASTMGVGTRWSLYGVREESA